MGEPRRGALKAGWRRDCGREVLVSRYFDAGRMRFSICTIRCLSLLVCVSIIPTSPHGSQSRLFTALGSSLLAYAGSSWQIVPLRVLGFAALQVILFFCYHLSRRPLAQPHGRGTLSEGLWTPDDIGGLTGVAAECHVTGNAKAATFLISQEH